MKTCYTWLSYGGVSLQEPGLQGQESRALRVSSTMAAHPYSQAQFLHLQRGGTWANGGGSRVSRGETLILGLGKYRTRSI